MRELNKKELDKLLDIYITGWIKQNMSNHIKKGFLPKNTTGELIIKNIF